MVQVSGKQLTYLIEVEPYVYPAGFTPAPHDYKAIGNEPDPFTLPAKATVAKPFRFEFPNPGAKAKYDLLPQTRQKYPTLDVTPAGVLTWTPPTGTPARPFRLDVSINGRLQTFLIDVENDATTALTLPMPASWVVLPDNVTLILALRDKAQLVYVDTLAIKETKRVDLTFKPGPMAFQGKDLFVAVQGSGLVHVLDLASGEDKTQYPMSDAALGALVCHPEKGLLYGSNARMHVFALDPASGKAQDTGAQGMFLAIDPIKGDALFTGIQGQTLLMKYAIQGNKLEPVGANNNAARNGLVLRITPDGKRVSIVGGGGYRPPPGGAATGGPGYGIALFGTDDVKAMQGIAECGAYPRNVAFHPVLDLGVAEQATTEPTFHLFNSKSLVELSKMPFASNEGPPKEQGPSELLAFGGRGTKILFYDTNGAVLRLLPLQLSEQEKQTLEKAYGK
jgi:hypothetical protein